MYTYIYIYIYNIYIYIIYIIYIYIYIKYIYVFGTNRGANTYLFEIFETVNAQNTFLQLFLSF